MAHGFSMMSTAGAQDLFMALKVPVMKAVSACQQSSGHPGESNLPSSRQWEARSTSYQLSATSPEYRSLRIANTMATTYRLHCVTDSRRHGMKCFFITAQEYSRRGK